MSVPLLGVLWMVRLAGMAVDLRNSIGIVRGMTQFVQTLILLTMEPHLDLKNLMKPPKTMGKIKILMKKGHRNMAYIRQCEHDHVHFHIWNENFF